MNIYNVTNHRLDAEKLRKINEFSTDLYGGVLCNSNVGNVFTYTNNAVTINEAALIDNELYILGGGCLITLIQSDLPTQLENKVYYLQVITDFSADNIVSDVSSNISIVATDYTPTETNNIAQYIEMGRAIPTDDGFKIPLFRVNGSDVISIVHAKDKSTLQDWLSANALTDLWTDLHATFVHQTGSTSTNPDYGKLGNFNINQDSILHNNTPFITATDTNRVKLNTNYQAGAAVIDSNHELSSVATLPVTLGGTGATSKGQTMKHNLGIYWGTSSPEAAVNNPAIGDLYFKILEG